jgi:hypothetical protein
VFENRCHCDPGIKRNDRRHSQFSYKEACLKNAESRRDSQSIQNKESKNEQ